MTAITSTRGLVKQNMNDFTKGSIPKQLIAFAVPMLVGNVFQQLYNIADALVVGRFIGGEALAAVGISMNIALFFISILIGLTTGAATVISQYFGAKKNDRLKAAVSVSIVFYLVLSVLLSVFGVLFAPQMLRMLNSSPEVFDDALIYLRIIMGGMIFPVFYNMYIAYLRALGDTRRPLFILIFTVLLNAALTVYCIAVLDMGVVGAAVSTIFSQMLATILCYLYARRYVPLLMVKKLAFDFELFRTILRYGAPAALQLSFISLAHLFITRLINFFGPAAMAGITAVTRIDALAIMPIATLGMALSTFVAQNMGAKMEDRARKSFHISLVYMLAFAVFISAVLMLFSTELISLFLNPDDINSPEILNVGQSYLNIMVIFYFMFAVLFAFNGFFRGVGDAIIAMVFPVMSLTIRTLSAYGLVYFAGMGPSALAWSIPIGWGINCLASYIYYKKRLWVGKLAA
jgi:putative MATE family efflux protein